MLNNKIEIGNRLKMWGLEHFETLAEFAKKLDIAPQNLNNYINGERTPGNKMKWRLRQLGCDIIWLITGEKVEATVEKYNESLMGRKMRLTEQQVLMAEHLQMIGIDNLEKLKYKLELANGLLIAAEKAEKYKPKEGK